MSEARAVTLTNVVAQPLTIVSWGVQRVLLAQRHLCGAGHVGQCADPLGPLRDGELGYRC